MHTRDLLIKSPWIDKILAGKKTWEIRGSATKMRGAIALIRSGSGLIVGTCELVDVVGPLTLNALRRTVNKHQVRGLTELPYANTFAWVFRNAKRLRKPKPYKHPAGAIIWVRLHGA